LEPVDIERYKKFMHKQSVNTTWDKIAKTQFPQQGENERGEETQQQFNSGVKSERP